MANRRGGATGKFARKIISTKRTVEIVPRPTWYTGSSNRKSVRLELLLECGRTVFRKGGDHPGHPTTKCEWCESGEEPQEEIA